jgi:hypothetical protein
MSVAIYGNPGQIINIYLSVKDNTGALHDGYEAPTVDLIIDPLGNHFLNLPNTMNEVSFGIWKYSLTIPVGATSLGTYLISCSWPSPDTAIFQNELFIINISLPFGMITAIPG